MFDVQRLARYLHKGIDGLLDLEKNVIQFIPDVVVVVYFLLYN